MNELRDMLAIPRPRTRGECRNGDARPCPWFGCEHHLVLEVIATTSPRRRANALAITSDGARVVLHSGPVDDSALDAFIDAAIERLLEMPETCELDVRESGDRTAAEVAAIVGVTPGQVRRIERTARSNAKRGSNAA